MSWPTKQRPADVDLRGFAYALEPVHQQRDWCLQRLQVRLARAQQALRETQERMRAIEAQIQTQMDPASRVQPLHLQPVLHQRLLTWLLQRKNVLKELQAQHDEQAQHCVQLRAQCTRAQLDLEGVERHREEAMADFAHALRGRQSSEQDRDWLARTGGPSSNRSFTRSTP